MSIALTIDPTITLPASTSLGVMADQIRITAVNTAATSSYADFLAAVRAAFPANGSHPDFDNLVVIGVEPLEVMSPNSAYRFQINFAQLEGGSVPDDVSDAGDLTLQPARIENMSWDFYSEPISSDRFGDVITNSAGDPENPAGIVERSRCAVTISKWVLGYDGNAYSQMFGKLNDAPTAIPGIGPVDARQVRCLSIAPAAGFNPYLAVPVTYTGSATFGDSLLWGSFGTGSYGKIIGGFTTGILTVCNASAAVANGDTFSDANTNASFSATAIAAVNLRPIKVLTSIEWRETGFDTKDLDAGSRAFYFIDGASKSQLTSIVTAGNTIQDCVPLNQGIPATYAHNNSDNTYYSDQTSTGNWDTNTSNTDQLATRIAAGNVQRISGPLVDFLVFQRIDQTDFSLLPII